MQVMPAPDWLDAALTLAAELATRPSLRLAAVLAAVHRGTDASFDGDLAIEKAAVARIVPTHDAQEGMAAFLERRPPVFLGRVVREIGRVPIIESGCFDTKNAASFRCAICSGFVIYRKRLMVRLPPTAGMLWSKTCLLKPSFGHTGVQKTFAVY